MNIQLTIPSTGKSYELDPDKLTYGELEAVENTLDITAGELFTKINRGSVIGWKVMLWLALRREDPYLRFDDLPFSTDDFKMRRVADEGTSSRAASVSKRAGKAA